MQKFGCKTPPDTNQRNFQWMCENWQSQGMAPEFGIRQSRLADAYAQNGNARHFHLRHLTCLDDVPAEGEDIVGSDTMLSSMKFRCFGARTVKHPDYLGSFICHDGARKDRRDIWQKTACRSVEIAVELPGFKYDDALWPMLGWLAGPLVTQSQSSVLNRPRNGVGDRRRT